MWVQSRHAHARYSSGVVTNAVFDTRHWHGCSVWTSGVRELGRGSGSRVVGHRRSRWVRDGHGRGAADAALPRVAGRCHRAPIGRRLGLAAVDPVLVIEGRRHELATCEWSSGVVAPQGYRHLTSFDLIEGVPRWRWQVGDVVLEAEVAMLHGRPVTGVVHRLVSSPHPVQLELAAVANVARRPWRTVRLRRRAGAAGRRRVRLRQRLPGARTWLPGSRRVVARLVPTRRGGTWATGQRRSVPRRHVHGRPTTRRTPLGRSLGRCPRRSSGDRDRGCSTKALSTRSGRAEASTSVERMLSHAADQFIVAGPTVVAGYPWFGDWSRDTFTSYEGLFLCTGRYSEGASLLRRAASTVSEGMLREHLRCRRSARVQHCRRDDVVSACPCPSHRSD